MKYYHTYKSNILETNTCMKYAQKSLVNIVGKKTMGGHYRNIHKETMEVPRNQKLFQANYKEKKS